MKRIAFILALVSILIACGGRVPSPERAQKSIYKYFNKYGKKFPTTVFGQGVEKVEVYSRDEIQYLLVSVDAIVVTKDGAAERVEVTLQRKAGAWKVVSWERAE